MDAVVLEKEVETLRHRNVELENEVSILREKLQLALMRQFGKSSEKVVGQIDLPFEDLKENETPESIERISVESHERLRKAGRKPLSDSLPRVEHYHDLQDHEKICACGQVLTKIGEDVCEKLNMIPAQVWVDRHCTAKYACKHCQGLSEESKSAVKTASGINELIPRSIVSAGLLAQVWTAKFCDHLPFYRQEVGFARIGAAISRQDMVNWTMKVAQLLTPLIEELEKTIRSGEVIQMDETPVKVLKLDHNGKDGEGWMWLARGGPFGKKVVRYRFAPGRGNLHAKSFLCDWKGFLQTDGYKAYDLAVASTEISHVGCWAHARRKFTDAEKVAPSNLTKDAIGRIKKLYKLEDELRALKLPGAEFLERRKLVMGRHLDEFKSWIFDQSAKTLPSGKTGEALAYTIKQWDKLLRFLDHVELTPDNNKAENAIRPFVLGRKNWMFAGNDAGAEASCRVYTLIETAKVNGLEPYAYLRSILEKLPSVKISGDWKSLLPWNITPKSHKN